MGKEFSRVQRVEGLVARKLAEIIHADVNDPRIGIVSITEVNISKDLAYAKVYFTALSDDANEILQITAVLNQAKGFLRRQLSAAIDLRITPALSFIHDDSAERGQRINHLIDATLKNNDQ